MSTQIAVRLADEQVAYIDSEVAAGRATSRADLIARLLLRERRRQRALDDIARMKAAGFPGYADLADIPVAASRLKLDIE